MHDYQESVTTEQMHRQTDRQTSDKVIPMCRYASQATQKCVCDILKWPAILKSKTAIFRIKFLIIYKVIDLMGQLTEKSIAPVLKAK